MDHSLSQIAEMDRGSVLHPFTHAKDYASGKAGDPTIITGGKGQGIIGVTFAIIFAGAAAAVAKRPRPATPKRGGVIHW